MMTVYEQVTMTVHEQFAMMTAMKSRNDDRIWTSNDMVWTSNDDSAWTSRNVDSVWKAAMMTAYEKS